MEILRKLIGIALFLLVSSLTYSQSNYRDYSVADKTVFFEDGFDNNTNNWEISSTKDFKKFLEDGNYFIKYKSYWTKIAVLREIQIDNKKDFEYEINFKILKFKYRLFLEIKLEDPTKKIKSGYSFLNRGVSIFFECREKSIEKSEIKQYLEDNAIKTDQLGSGIDFKINEYNKITIRRISERYYFFLNETFLTEIYNVDLDVNRIVFAASESLIGIDHIKISYLIENVNTAFNTAKYENSLEAYELFIKHYSDQIQANEARGILTKLKWEKYLDKTDTLQLHDYIKEYPSTIYAAEARTLIEKIRKEKKAEADFYGQIKNIVSNDDLTRVYNSFKNSGLAKYDYFYQPIVKVEKNIFREIWEKGLVQRFHIPDIKPFNSTKIKGKCVLAGRGSLPEAKSCCEREGEGAFLSYIGPVVEGAEINIVLGNPKFTLKNVKFDSDPKKASFGQLDQSANFAPGAQWKLVANILKDGKVAEKKGVLFSKGLYVGALYDGDSNLVIDYIKAGSHTIICPAGTSGSIHRIMGEVMIGDYKFIGSYDPAFPLTFMLDSDYGYVYIRGRGSVIFPNGSKKEFN